MFTSIQTYSLAANDTCLMLAVSGVRPWGQGRFHGDADITLAGRSLR